MLEILPLPALKDNYIWLLKHSEREHVAIVDPSEAEPVFDYLNDNKLTPAAILITHHHWDHVGGIPALTECYTIPVITPALEEVQGSTRKAAENDSIDLQEIGCCLSVLDVPGHTAGAVAYYTDEFVFSGDTLFTAGCGRMFEGTAPQMHTSLSKFKALPDTTKIYCGHEYSESNLRFASTVEPDNTAVQTRQEQVSELRKQSRPTVPTTLALEKQTNPFLRCEEPSVIRAATEYKQAELNQPHQVFAALREWKDNF